MTTLKKPARTQYFSCVRDGNPDSDKPGRYLALVEGAKRPVFRYWTGAEWQYNRRKKGTPAGFGSRPGDMWAGAAEIHPRVPIEIAMALNDAGPARRKGDIKTQAKRVITQSKMVMMYGRPGHAAL